MKRRKLTDFLPLYSDAKTGKIVIDEPPRAETPDLTTPEMDKLAGDERPVLPELHTNDLLRSKSGALWRVYRVARPKRDAYAEPTYRLSKIDTITIKGRSEFTGEELSENGMELYNEHS